MPARPDLKSLVLLIVNGTGDETVCAFKTQRFTSGRRSFITHDARLVLICIFKGFVIALLPQSNRVIREKCKDELHFAVFCCLPIFFCFWKTCVM